MPNSANIGETFFGHDAGSPNARAYSEEFFGVHNFSGSSPPLPLGIGALGVGPLESS